MKNRVARILSIGIALVAVAAVHAQDRVMTANVPFMFYAGSTLMPQGAYRVDEMPTGVAWIASKDHDVNKAFTTFNVVGKKRDEPARLVFHRYGEDYFLAEIWPGGVPTGRALVRSHREKELAHSGAAPTLAVVLVALHR